MQTEASTTRAPFILNTERGVRTEFKKATFVGCTLVDRLRIPQCFRHNFQQVDPARISEFLQVRMAVVPRPPLKTK